MTDSPTIPAPAGASGPPALALLRGAFRVMAPVAPWLASRVALELFRTPRRFRTPPRETALLHDAEPFAIRLGVSRRIQAWRTGSGPAVILMHGWEGRGSQMAAFTPALVASGFQVITFDAPGHGRSSGRRSSLPHFTWALRAVADSVGEPHAVIAHSLGCAAATLAVRDGMHAGRLVFVAPPLNPEDYTRQFGAMFGLPETVVEGLRLRIEERFLRKWADYSLAGSAPRMTVPLLIVHDRADEETLWSGGAALAGLWPRARLVTTEGLGHRRVLRDPGVIEEVVEFVKRDS